ncbi:hypothetical protein ACFSTI_26930 [Rhizorhabdus histidinilytica]
MNDLYLIVDIAGQRALLPAAFVESVVEIGDIAPVPCAPRTCWACSPCAAAC